MEIQIFNNTDKLFCQMKIFSGLHLQENNILSSFVSNLLRSMEHSLQLTNLQEKGPYRQTQKANTEDIN
jgi:hypothetical protein